ncbi:unnamed protein product [Trichogramma brassicae]|uniref:Uncharacterized protein n=1 Tax=Trichogramma brassicae TaxID=86971 RepID=A0A6H5IUA1_9HYME|nr:unnamed protein product [Trichogramma brassicae]
MYDSILRLRLDDGVRIVGFADDIAVVTVAGTTYEVEDLLSRAIARVRDALWGLGLETADHKTEALLFSRKRRLETITIEVGDCFIASSPCIRYLGIQLDARLTFNDHLIAASEKASKVAGALSQIMPTIGGPRSSRRRLYANVIDSILLYGAPIWSCGLGARAGLRRAEAIHRRTCLRVISGRPHLSYDATYVLASIPPLALLADERSRLHQRHHEDARAEERQETLKRWQSQWDRSPKGRWTHRLIPNIRSWIESRHGELLGSAQLKLGKWAANDPALLRSRETPDDVVSVNLDEAQSALGVRWLPRRDSFIFVHHAQPEKTIYIKRIVLAEVSRLFDPLGWISPIIIVAKILLQDLWLNGLDWDEPLQDELLTRWIEFKSSLPDISRIEIPRWFTRMVEGISITPSEFKQIMSECLQGIPNVIAYMDNIYVIGKTDEDYLANLRSVCQRLTERGHCLNKDKCDFMKDRIEILGYGIDKHGLHKATSKVITMYEAPQPKDTKQLSSFLGLINFYARFLKNRSDKLKPLFDCARRDKFEWTKECDEAFWWVKNLMISPKVLVH